MSQTDLETALAALEKNWKPLAVRIKTVEHEVATSCSHLTLRLHFPAFRERESTVNDLVEVISKYLARFCLPRKQLAETYAKKATLSDDDYHLELTRLDHEAASLFIRGNRLANKNGEGGELLLYLMTEWILQAPQIIAKMSLKTNRQVPAHGSDGIHVKYDAAAGKLVIFSGEAKLQKSISKAIRSAVESIGNALNAEQISHELALIKRNLDLSGLDETAKAALVEYINPFGSSSNARIEAVTCLIAFDFKAFEKIRASANNDDPEAAFAVAARKAIARVAPIIARALTDAGLSNRHMELFLFPLPSTDAFRTLFQNRIGWTES